jgi:Trk K+ transport system NAD-binding subunit
LLFLLSVPVLVVVLALIYMIGMEHLEGSPRTLRESIEFISETLTSTGYGHDNTWDHPGMVLFVITMQFAGVVLVLMVFPIVLIPFIEERLAGRMPRVLPDLRDQVLIYRYGPAVLSLVKGLGRAKIPFVILEEDEGVAARLRDRGHRVVFAQLDEDDPELPNVEKARAIVTNGQDHQNAVLTLNARQQGFEGPIVAMMDSPYLRNPLIRAGATAAFTPSHILGAAIAAKASAKINPRVSGAQPLGRAVEVAEVRISKDSDLAGKTLVGAAIAEKTGATIIGRWEDGELVANLDPNSPIEPGSILVAAGSAEAIEALGEIATPIKSDGPLVVFGLGGVGRKVVEFLRLAGEEVIIVDRDEKEGVDIVGDALDPAIYRKAGVERARAVILTLAADSKAIFATALMRDVAADVVIIGAVTNASNFARMHRAGADFIMSVAQVSAQMLSLHVLGEESVEVQPQLKLVKAQPGELEGKNPVLSHVRSRTGCSVVAVERGDDVLVDLGGEFRFEAEDTVYICGSPANVTEFFEVFPGTRQASG